MLSLQSSAYGAKPEIHPLAFCLLDDISSILLTESSKQCSGGVCETAHEASVPEVCGHVYLSMTLLLRQKHFRLNPKKSRENFSSHQSKQLSELNQK